jgi:hypothetical protein
MKKLTIILLIITLIFTSYYVGKRYYKYKEFHTFLQSFKDNPSLGSNIYWLFKYYFVQTKNAPFDKNAFRDTSFNVIQEHDYYFKNYYSVLKDFLKNEDIGYFDSGDSLISYYIINNNYKIGKVDTAISFYNFLFLNKNILMDSYPKPDKWELMDKETRRRERFRDRYKKMYGYYPEQSPKDGGTVKE